MTNTHHRVKHVVMETIFKSRMIDHPQELDTFINETVGRLIQAIHDQDALLSEKQVSPKYPFLSVKQLQNWRYRHQGIKYIKTGTSRNSRVLYRVSDIEAFLAKHEQNEQYVNRES